MELKNFKSLCWMMAFVICVCSSANVVSFGVPTNDQPVAELETLTGENKENIQSLLNVIDISKCEDVSKFLSKDGKVNIESLPTSVAMQLYNWAKENKYNISSSNGEFYLYKNGKTIITEQIADILYKEDNNTDLTGGNAGNNSSGNKDSNTNSNGDINNTSSNNSNSLVSSTDSNSSTADTLFTYDNQLTNSPVVSSFILSSNNQGIKVDGEKIVEKLLNSTQPASVTLNVPNVRWVIESSSLDKNDIKGYQFEPYVSIKNFKELDSNVSDGLKSIINGQEGKVVSWAEKNGEKLPFNAKVIVSMGADSALKDFDIYYVVAGQTYNLGKFKLDSKGQIILNFKVIGDFVLKEHK